MVRGSPEKRYDPRGIQKIKKKTICFRPKNRSFDRIVQFYLFFVPRIHFWLENRIPEQSAYLRWFLVILVFFFSKFRKLWNLRIEVSIDFFNSIYLLVPGLIFDQKIEILTKLNMRWAQISCILVIFVFSFFEILKIVKQIWNLTPKVSIEFFNSIFFLVPWFIFDQKFGFLSELNMRSAKISWILVIFVFLFFKFLRIVKN